MIPRGWVGLLACGSLYSPRLPIPLRGTVACADFITAYSCGAAVDSPPLGIHHLPYTQPLLSMCCGTYPESLVAVKKDLEAVRKEPANAGEEVVTLERLGDVIICPVQPAGFLCMVFPRVHLGHHNDRH